MEGSGYKELNVNLDFLDKLVNEDTGAKNKKIYEAFSGLSFLVLEARAGQFKRGWASSLKDRYNDQLFNSRDCRVLEEVAQTYFKPIFQGTIGFSQVGSDKRFAAIDDYFNELAQMVKGVSREFGTFRFFHERGNDFKALAIPLQSGQCESIKVPLGPRAAPVTIGLVIEAIRIIFQISPQNAETTRGINLFLLGLIDILKGDWKQGIVSIVEFFQTAPLVGRLIGKVILKILEFIAPELQEFLEGCEYKDLLTAFFLWGFTNFSPDSEQHVFKKYMNFSDYCSLSQDDIKSIQISFNDDLHNMHVMKLVLDLMSSKKTPVTI